MEKQEVSHERHIVVKDNVFCLFNFASLFVWGFFLYLSISCFQLKKQVLSSSETETPLKTFPTVAATWTSSVPAVTVGSRLTKGSRIVLKTAFTVIRGPSFYRSTQGAFRRGGGEDFRSFTVLYHNVLQSHDPDDVPSKRPC